MNLLRDFEGVSEWIRACKDVQPEHVEILAKHEVLRTCEGVGKILLRKPFEIIPMTEQINYSPGVQPQKSSGNCLRTWLMNDIMMIMSIFFLMQSRKVKRYYHQRCLYQTKFDGWSYEQEIEIDSTR